MTSLAPVVETTVNRLIESCEQILKNCIGADRASLRSAWNHQLSARGKRLRMKLALHISLSLGLAESQAVQIATACELVHQASLVHDDLMDSDPTRNGKPTVWREYGSETAVCLGDALIVEAMFQAQCIPIDSTAHHRAIAQLFKESIQAAAEGQIDDCDTTQLAHRTYQDYCIAVKNKSGALFGLPVLAAMILRDYPAAEIQQVKEAFAEFGVAYQLLDDLNDRHFDRDRRLNGYWVLAENNSDDTSQALHFAVSDHLNTADTMVQRLPESVQMSFKFIRDAIMAKRPKLEAVN